MKLILLLSMCVLCLIPPLYSRFRCQNVVEFVDMNDENVIEYDDEPYQVELDDPEDCIKYRGCNFIIEAVTEFWAPLNLFF